jgi:regulatory protein
MTEEGLGMLVREDGRWRTRETALRLLSYRPRSARELRQRLRQKGFAPEDVDWCLEQLDTRGLVDDAAFAEMFSRDRIRLRPQGRRRMVQELRARGVDPETASEAVHEVMQEEQVDELALARQAAGRWKPRVGEERERARRRLSGFLARRGFGAEATRRVMEEVLGGE